MLRATEIAGFAGALLAAGAYVPQIWHLVRERCAAGLSRSAFLVWLFASFLVATRAVAIREAVFIALGVVQLVATGVILFYCTRFAGMYCELHRPFAQRPERAKHPEER